MKDLNTEVAVATTEAPTLKAIAIALDVPYTRLHGVSKQPQEGVIYDRNMFNWDAIYRFIDKRLDPDKGFATRADVLAKAAEIDVELKLEDGRRAPMGKKMVTLADGTEIVGRKLDIAVGDKLTIKKEAEGTVYTVVYATITHLVLQLDGTETLVVMSNNTANWKIATVVKPTV